jgi:hypothetical protein
VIKKRYVIESRELTLRDALAVLEKARKQAKGQGRGIRARRAARNIWLAVCMIADVIDAPRESHEENVFEVFRNAWGSEGYGLAGHINAGLYCGCFLSNGAACDGVYVGKYARLLIELLKKPARNRAVRDRIDRRW